MSSVIQLSEAAYNTIADFAGKCAENATTASSVQKSLETQNYEEIYQTLLSTADAILTKSTVPEDVDVFFTILIQTILKGNKEKQGDKFQQLIQTVTAKNSNAISRATTLSNIIKFGDASKSYNYDALLQLLKFAQQNKLHDFVTINYIDSLDTVVAELKLNNIQRQEVFEQAETILRERGNAQGALNLLLKHALSYPEADKSEVVAKVGTRAIVESIKDSKYSNFDDLSDVPAVKLVKEKSPKLYELFRIFVSGSVGDYQKFYDGNKELLSQFGLSHENALSKIRLLALTTILSVAGAEIPYDTLADQLQVPKNEIERWVIRAVGAQIINARLDQVRRVVIVVKPSYREFGQEQWKSLSSQLSLWRESVAGILNKIQVSKQEKQTK